MRVKSLGLRVACGAALATAVLAPSAALAKDGANLKGGNLLVSGSVYRGADITQGVTMLPPGCTTGCAVANADGTYPFVWNNDTVDASFGVASPIFLDDMSPDCGQLLPNTAIDSRRMIVTSFSSKSELALNLSTGAQRSDVHGLRRAGLTRSTCRTPTRRASIDPTNPVGVDYRAVPQSTTTASSDFTRTNAYSGNNGRAAILNDSGPT